MKKRPFGRFYHGFIYSLSFSVKWNFAVLYSCPGLFTISKGSQTKKAIFMNYTYHRKQVETGEPTNLCVFGSTRQVYYTKLYLFCQQIKHLVQIIHDDLIYIPSQRLGLYLILTVFPGLRSVPVLFSRIQADVRLLGITFLYFPYIHLQKYFLELYHLRLTTCNAFVKMTTM